MLIMFFLVELYKKSNELWKTDKFISYLVMAIMSQGHLKEAMDFAKLVIKKKILLIFLV